MGCTTLPSSGALVNTETDCCGVFLWFLLEMNNRKSYSCGLPDIPGAIISPSHDYCSQAALNLPITATLMFSLSHPAIKNTHTDPKTMMDDLSALGRKNSQVKVCYVKVKQETRGAQTLCKNPICTSRWLKNALCFPHRESSECHMKECWKNMAFVHAAWVRVICGLTWRVWPGQDPLIPTFCSQKQFFCGLDLLWRHFSRFFPLS